MILTVTLNTALDITYRVPGLRPHASHRVTEVTERPGGKGLNVARVLAALGHPVTVTGFAGGSTGATVRASLAGVPGVVDALVPVAGATRRTVAVVDERTGDTTQLNEPGPVVAPAEWNAFQEAYEGLLAGAAAVALCGSLPPGVPVGAYAGLVRTARAAGCRCCWTPAGSRCAGGRRPARPDQAERRRAGRADRFARAAAGHAGGPAPRRPLGGGLAGGRRAARRDPGGPLAGGAARPGARQPDRRRRLGGRGAAVRAGGAPALAGPPGPRGRPVRGDGAVAGGGRVRPAAYEELLGRGSR